MADNIRTYTSPVDQLRPTNVGAEAFEMEGRHIESSYAGAGAALGQGLGVIGRQVEEHQTLVESADVMNKMSDLEVSTARGIANAKNTMDPHDPDAAGNFIGQYDEQLSKIGDDLGTKGAKEMYNRMSSEYKTRTLSNFISMQSQAAANDATSKMQSSIQNFSNLANEDPTFTGAGATAINLAAQTVPVEHRTQFIKEGMASVYDSAGEGVVGRVEGQKVYDPQSVQNAKDFINDPKNGYVQNMSANKFAELNNRLDNARRSGNQMTIAGMQLNSPALLKQVQLTGQDPNGQIDAMIGTLKAVGTPEGNAAAAELNQKREDAQGYYGANQVVTKTPAPQLQDRRAELEEMAKTAPTGEKAAIAQAALSHFDEATKVRYSAFHDNDPSKRASWELENNPSVTQSYKAFQANPTPETFLTYYQKSYADQKALEPGVVPSVLTPDMVDQGHAAVNMIATDPKAGPMQSAQALTTMSQLYGQAWPQIAGDLRKKGVFSGDQFVAAGLYGKPEAVRWGEQLLRASVLSPEQRANQYGISEAKAQSLVRPEISTLVTSMGNINNAGELIDEYTNAAAKIIQTTNNQDATTMVKTMFLDSYQFTGAGKTIRTPLGINADAIGSGSENVLHDIGNHDLVIPEGHLGSINQKENWTDAIKTHGTWYTSPDGTGATLYDGPATGNPVMERRNGRVVPVTLGWGELERLGKRAPATQAQIEAEEKMAVQAGH